MRNIPRIAHFYWGGTVMPYLRYMCLYSFKKYNPNWRIILYTPTDLTSTQSWGTFENKEELNTEDYSHRLKDIGVEVCPFSMSTLGYSDDLPEVTKSDLLRLYVLYTHGGLWSDNDILYFRPMNHTFKNTHHTAYFCYRRGGPTQADTPENGPLYHSIGFLMGAVGNPYFKRLFVNAKSRLNPGNYQSVGSPYYAQMINIKEANIHNIDIQVVYPSRSPQVMFSLPASTFTGMISPNTIGWHWYGGHPECGKGQNLVTENNYRQFDTIISYLLRRINGK